MTVLNDANKLYLGNLVVNKIYLGTQQVFPVVQQSLNDPIDLPPINHLDKNAPPDE